MHWFHAYFHFYYMWYDTHNKYVFCTPAFTHTPSSTVQAMDQSTLGSITVGLHPLHVSTKGQHHLKTPERHPRHELLHQCGYTNSHTPQLVWYKLWIKVPRVVSKWGFSHCMCQQKVNTTSKPRKGILEMNCCTSVGTPVSTHHK
jgi:hypothetical protein